LLFPQALEISQATRLTAIRVSVHFGNIFGAFSQSAGSLAEMEFLRNFGAGQFEAICDFLRLGRRVVTRDVLAAILSANASGCSAAAALREKR